MSRRARRRSASVPAESTTAPPAGAGSWPADSPATPDRPWAELACGLIAFGVYVFTLAPTVVGGDSGELAAVGATLGVAHPPGYPLYTLLAKLFTFVPWGGVAHRVNLLSAVCGAAAAALLCRAVRRWSGSAWGGTAAAFAFAFSPLVWPYAVTAEVFPLNNLLVASLLLAMVGAETASDDRRSRWLVAFAGLAGLALSNHHTSVFVIAPFGAYLLWRCRSTLSPGVVALCAVAAALGLAPYLYLPWAASRHPAIAWGDASTWSGFWAHLLRREYGTFRLASQDVGASGSWGPRVGHVIATLATSSFGLAPVLLVIAGALGLRARNGRARLTLLVMGTLAFYVVTFAALANVRWDDPLHRTVQDRFWQQAVLLASALLGVGLAGLLARVGRAASVVGPAVGVGTGVLMAAAHLGASDQHANTLFLDYGRSILEPLPPRTILLITSDEAVGAVRYLQSVEGVRPDVRILPTGQVTRPWMREPATRMGVVVPPGDAFTARAFIDANLASGPVFVVNRVPWLATLEEAYALWPVGVAEQATRKGRAPELSSWIARVDDAFARFDPGAGAAHPSGTWERYVSDNVEKLDRRFALALPTAAASYTDKAAAASAVVHGLEAYLARRPAPDARAHKNLGVAYQLLAPTRPDALELAARHWTIALALEPNDPDRNAMRELVERSKGAPAAGQSR